jgi:predicted  nucleic acid-binding Zn-ribbon protein
VIEFVLLFALGFLAAALVALIVAPIIHRRVVSLTERRIRASVPLSVAEIRAEKDMARAAYAAENARLSVDLKHNRDQLTESVARGTRLSNELVAIRAEKLDAVKKIEEQESSIRDLNAQMHDRDAKITTLTGNFSDAARLAEARKHEIAMRDDQINRLGSEIEELRIDLVTLDTEAENFKSQIRELRTERNQLREALRDAEATSRDLENRLKSNDERLSQNDEKLAKTITALTDRENALERRIAEVDRFKKKNRELSDELRATKAALKEANSQARKAATASGTKARPTGAQAGLAAEAKAGEDPDASPPAPNPPAAETAGPTPEPATTEPATADAAPRPSAEIHEIVRDKPNGTAASAAPSTSRQQKAPAAEQAEELTDDEKVDRLRARQAALIERLLKADKGDNDAALRREIAMVAAMMVELTASRDGEASPIHNILKGGDDASQAHGGEPSLATRSRQLLVGNS